MFYYTGKDITMKIILSILLLILFTSCGTVEHKKPITSDDKIIVKTLAEADTTLIEFCKENNCRKDNSFKLIRANKSVFDYSSELDPPAIQGEYITIFPGETLYIEAEETDTKPINFVQVKEISNPSKTIIFRFWQELDAKTPRMMLEVTNPFSKPLRYNLFMMDTFKYNLYKTSSCPVSGKIFEMWGDTIFQLLFENLRFVQEGESMSCVE